MYQLESMFIPHVFAQSCIFDPNTNTTICPDGNDGTSTMPGGGERAIQPEELEANLHFISQQQGLTPQLMSIGGILSRLTPWLFTFAGIALFIYLIMGGFSYLTSSGDPKKVESARGRITAALIGFIIVFVAFWIVQIVAYIFGINSLRSFFGLPQ